MEAVHFRFKRPLGSSFIRPVSVQVPSAFGPRHCGQSAECIGLPERKTISAQQAKYLIIVVIAIS